MKVLFFFTSHRQSFEFYYQSKIINNYKLFKPDILVYNNNIEIEYKDLVNKFYLNNNIKLEIYQDSENTGYVTGLFTGLVKCFDKFANYDYVVHLHPDVFLINENKIFEILKQNLFSDVEMLISKFPEEYPQKSFYTDFFIFKPKKNFFINYNKYSHIGAAEQILFNLCKRENITFFERYKDSNDFNILQRRIDRFNILHTHDLRIFQNNLIHWDRSINDLDSIVKKLIFLTKDENGREIGIYNLKDVKVTGHNLFYPNVLLYSQNKLYNPIKEQTMSLKLADVNNVFDYKYENVLNTEYNPVFYFIYNTDNYYHFVYDTLPYLISFLDIRSQIPNIKILMNYSNPTMSDFYKFVSEFLDLLDIKESDILIVDKNTEYKNVFISSSYTHGHDSNLPPRKEIYSFYKNIVDIVKSKYKLDTPKKIYISRRTWLHNNFSNIGTNYTTRRKLNNEDELVDLLIKNGYEEIFTENLSTIEKIITFANADVIVGAIGGGISNVLFSKKEAKLVALISPTFLDINNRFRYSLDCVNTIYFNKSSHVETEYWKKYMRIKSNDIIGEIEEVKERTLIISYTDEMVAGWNSKIEFKKIEIEKSNCKALDNGLNSAWIIDIEDLKKYIN